MTTRKLVTLLTAATFTFSSCGTSISDADISSTTKAPSERSTTTSKPAPSSTKRSPSTTAESTADTCPDVPRPDDVASTAPAAFDGDGKDDKLTTFQDQGKWWIGIHWAAGGSGSVMFDGEGMMGIKAIGGYDLDGDGTDEAFIAIPGPAAGVMVAVYAREGCGLRPLIVGNSEAFSFPVTATVGTFSSAKCESGGGITVMSGTIMDPDTGKLDIKKATYTLGSDGTMRGEESIPESLEGANLADVTGLQCGDLDDAMANLD